MAWNPSPKVAAARDYGMKFGKDMVIIIATDGREPPTLEAVTYGADVQLCRCAQVLGDTAYQAIQLAILQASVQAEQAELCEEEKLP